MADGTEVGSLYYDFDADDSKLQSKLTGTDDKVKSFGDRLGSGLKKAAAGFAVVGAGLTLYEKSAIDYTEGLYKASKTLGQQIGVSTSEASRLTAAFQRMGIDTDKTSTMFGIFSKKIAESTQNHTQNSLAVQKLNLDIQKTQMAIKDTTAEINKNGDSSGKLRLKLAELNNTLSTQKDQLNTTGDAFAKLGVSTVDAKGKQKDFETVLFEVADKFKAMPDGIDKTKASMDLFGRSGKDMVRVLDLGSQGIKDLEKAADKMGVTLTSKNIGAIAKLVQSQKDLAQSQSALKIAVATTTAPVLTDFNNKLSQVTQQLLNSHGPMHTATVDVLAFGGPVAGAAAGLTSFAGNLSSVSTAGLAAGAKMGAIGVAAVAATGAFTYLGYSIFQTAEKTGSARTAFDSWQAGILRAIPGVGLLTTVIAALGGQHMASAFHTDALRQAHDRLTQSLNAAKTAGDNLKNAELNLQGANLAVEQAQLNYNSAVAQYGPNSLQARQAAYELQVAHQNQSGAVHAAQTAVQNKSNADSAAAKNKSLENHLNEQRGAANNASSGIQGVIDKIAHFNAARIFSKILSVSVEVSGLGLLHKIHFPGFASGVTNFKGGLAVVGERGPELVNLPSGADVIPNNKSGDMLNNKGNKAGDTYVSIGEVNNSQDEAWVMRRIDRENTLQGIFGAA